MLSKYGLILLLIGLYVFNIETICIGSDFVNQRNILDFMLRTRDISNQDPKRSVDCFSYYIPILNEITREYERSYGVCLEKYNGAKILIDNSTQLDRNCMESKAKNACELLLECSKLENSIDYFECYVNQGAQNSKTMYSISTNASDILVNIKEQYRLIENDKFRCTNTSERAYIEDTTKNYEDLHNCLSGLSPVPPQKTQTDLSSEILAPSQYYQIRALPDSQATDFSKQEPQQFYIAKGIQKFKWPYKLY